MHWTERAGADVALRIITAILETIITLSEQPGIGVTASQFGEGVRKLPAGRYMIYYRRRKARGIEVLHVFHGAPTLIEVSDAPRHAAPERRAPTRVPARQAGVPAHAAFAWTSLSRLQGAVSTATKRSRACGRPDREAFWNLMHNADFHVVLERMGTTGTFI
jgi:plasmid stabilization system protein ParE